MHTLATLNPKPCSLTLTAKLTALRQPPTLLTLP